MTRTDLEQALREHLSATHVHVQDDSDDHAGHAGARPGESTHFTVLIVSADFDGKSHVERHRLVNKIFAQQLASGEIHALALTARTPAEWKAPS